MSEEAYAEALAMDYSHGALNGGADAFGINAQPESLAMDTQGAPHVHAESSSVTPLTTCVASVAAAGTAPYKNNFPGLELLHWSESHTHNPIRARFSATNDSSAFINASDESPYIQPPIRSELRTSQPAGGTSTISLGTNLTLEESEQLQKRRPGSDSKRREMTGSRIFGQGLVSETAFDQLAKKTLPAGLATPVQYGSGSSAISGNSASASLSETAKQQELSGTLSGDGRNMPTGRLPVSLTKSKELEGSNIFGRSSQDQLNTAIPKGLSACGRSQIVFGSDEGQQFGAQHKKKGYNQKAAELSGHDIFKDEASVSNDNNKNQHEQIVGAVKRREMLANVSLTDSNVVNEGHPRRSRQPPGGDSNLKLC